MLWSRFLADIFPDAEITVEMPVARSVESISLSNRLFGSSASRQRTTGPMINVAAIRMQQFGVQFYRHR